MSCLICLEELPDIVPPCMGVDTPLFHRKCLEMYNYFQREPRCPHCNIIVTHSQNTGIAKMDIIKHKIESIMQRWLQDSGYWIKGPEYVQVCDHLMHGNDAENASATIRKTIAQQLSLLSPITIYYSNPPAPDQDATVYRHRETSTGVETDVLIRRTAILNGASFQMDGFTISMSRSRYSPRIFRPPYVFDEKETSNGLLNNSS